MRHIFGFLFVLAAWSAPAFATDFTVTTTADTNDGVCDANCSLREAIGAANAAGGSDKVILGSGLSYTLSLGALSVTDTLTIDGHGSTVNGGGLDRVFDIQGTFSVTINELTITNGVASGFLSLGGGINIRNADVVLNNCIVSGNSTAIESGSRDDGGGIAVVGTFDATIPATTLASLTLNNSTVSNNTGSNGGGIVCVLCTLTIANSTISGNTAIGTPGSDGNGGGVDMVGNLSSLSMTSSTMVSNTVSAGLNRGGGLSVPFGTSTSTLTRDRIASNIGSLGSAVFNSVGSISAVDNWWGCNFGPGAGGAGCAGTANDISGFAPPATYLVLKGSTTPTAISEGQSSTMTADVRFNQSNTNTSGGGTLLDGTPVTFSATLGSFASLTVPTTGGKAIDVYTAGPTGGTANLGATLDGQTATVLLPVNSPPTITAISDQVINEDTPTGALAFTVGDLETAAGSLAVSGSSSNPTLVPTAPANITFGGSGANRTVTITPAADQSGTATITVTVSDGSLTASASFLVTVNAVNDPPTLNAIPNPPAILEDAGPQTVNLSGISAGGGETQTLTVTATSNNTALIPNPTVTYTSPSTTGSLSYTPVANASGSATMTVTVMDNGGGTNTFARTFTIAVTPVADTPSVTNATTSVNVQTTSGLVVTRNAADGPEVTHIKITGISNGTLFQHDGTTPIANNAFITYAQANAGLRFTPTANSATTGHVTVQASVSNVDAGLGGGTATADIIVNRPPPTISAIADTTTPRNTPKTVTFSVDDVVSGAAAVVVSGTSSNLTLVPNGNLVFGGSGAGRTLTLTPAAGQFGSTTITVTATVGSLSSNTSFVLDVPSNSAPTLIGLTNLNTPKNTPVTVTFTVGDADTGASSVTVSGNSSNPTLVPLANVVVGGSDAMRTATITPAVGQTGTTTITLTASDGSLSTSVSFVLAVYSNVRGDLSGDGKADLLWRNKATGQNIGYLFDGTTVAVSGFLPTVADTNWEIKGIGDFDGDGKSDVVWRNKVTGQNIAWLMNGLLVSVSAFLPTIADTNWEIKGVGDFDADGKADLIWRNNVTGQNIIWLMNGAALGSAAFLPTIADTNWEIVGVGDLDGGGKADLVWRNKVTGQNLAWLMNGASVGVAVFLAPIADLAWKIVGVGDLDGDGKADILLRNSATGQNVAWLMDGAIVVNSAFLATMAEPSWEIKSVGDREGDGRADIIWHNKETGEGVIWLMDGLTMRAVAALPTIADVNWEIVGS